MLPESGGLSIVLVNPDSPAARAGLRQYDVLVKVGEEGVGKTREFDQLVADSDAGRALVLTVIRGGREIEIPVVVEGRSISGPRPSMTVRPSIIQAQRIGRVPRNRNPGAGPPPVPPGPSPGPFSPASVARKPKTGIPYAQGPVRERQILVTTKDGETFDVAVESGEDQWAWTVGDGASPPENLPDEFAMRTALVVRGIEGERTRGTFRFRVQPRADGDNRSVVLLVQHATEDGEYRVLEIERTFEGFSLPVGRLLSVDSLKEELAQVDPEVRDRLADTLRRYRVPPVRASVRAIR